MVFGGFQGHFQEHGPTSTDRNFFSKKSWEAFSIAFESPRHALSIEYMVYGATLKRAGATSENLKSHPILPKFSFFAGFSVPLAIFQHVSTAKTKYPI